MTVADSKKSSLIDGFKGEDITSTYVRLMRDMANRGPSVERHGLNGE